jgi:SIR2-like domain
VTLINKYRVENKVYDADNVAGGAADPNKVNVHRRRIEPWLSAIFQSEHLNLLVGSGFSAGISRAAGGTPASMAPTSIDPALDALINSHAAASSKEMGRVSPNIEDQFRSAIAAHAGLAVLEDGRAAALKDGLDKALAAFATGILAMERQIAHIHSLDTSKSRTVTRLLSEFLLSFASRTASRDRLHIFTTNYDRLIEHGLDMIGARPIDRFVGALTPRFRASRFEVDIHYSPLGGRGDARPLEGVVRLTKLHGSIDWQALGRDIVRKAMPFGDKGSINPEDADRLMVFPNAAKDIETAFYPYAELFRDFSTAVCRPNAALVTYGYGFGDDHVNRIVRDMLSLPSTHLVVISYDDAAGRIPKFLDDCGREAQISYLIGPPLAGLEPLVDHYLPKPAIDSITKRQTELLEHRGRPAEGTGELS